MAVVVAVVSPILALNELQLETVFSRTNTVVLPQYYPLIEQSCFYLFDDGCLYVVGFQKMVSKGEETEQNLYNKVRNAEYARQKQEQTIKHLQLDLQEIKRKNAEKIKQELADSFRHEKECEEKILREKAELDKVR